MLFFFATGTSFGIHLLPHIKRFLMKKMYIIFGSIIIIFFACTGKKTLKETLVEIVVDDVEDLIESQTGIDYDINANGK